MTTDRIAFTSILDRDGKVIDGVTCHYRLVAASESGGYIPMKETGDVSDPFYVAKGRIWFAKREDAEAEATNRNAAELHLSPYEASSIIMRSIGASMRR